MKKQRDPLGASGESDVVASPRRPRRQALQRSLPKTLPKTTRGLALQRRRGRSSLPQGAGKSDSGNAALATSSTAHEAAAVGVAGPSRELPYRDVIQDSFGSHDVSSIDAHIGGDAARASEAMGAEAYATGNDVAFRTSPDLHTAAHEAAHVIQQRGGVQLKGGLGEEGDFYERHADAVADRVVRGQSAQDLLDPVARPSAAASSNGSVQRLIASDIHRDHLGQQNREYDNSSDPRMVGPKPFHGPSGGVELFSGSIDARIHWSVRIPPTYSREILQEDLASNYRPGDILPAGVPPQVTRNTTVAEWLMGPGADGYPGSYIVRDLEEELVSGQRPEPISEYARYRRERSDSPWYVTLNTVEGEYFHALGESLVLNGDHVLATEGDGDLLGSFSQAQVSPPWPNLLLDREEIEGFQQLFDQVQASSGAKNSWYAWARTGIYDGGDARAWILSSINEEAQQKNLVRSLQHLVVAGISQANTDLDAYVDALRDLIESDDTDATTRTILQNRLVESHFWSELRIDRGEFPDNPQDTPDTPDAQFDLIRLAGKVLAERSLIAGLSSTLDPVAFINNYPNDGPTPAHDLFDLVELEATTIRRQILDFMNNEITARNLGPACFGPDSLCGEDAQTSGLGREMTNHELALEAGRIGAAEAIHQSARQASGSPAVFTKTLGTLDAMGSLASQAAIRRPGAPMSFHNVVNHSAGELQPMLVGQSRELSRMGEELSRRQGRGAEADRRRGDALREFARLFSEYTISTDLASLRGQLGGVATSTMRQASIQTIQSHLGNQAMIAKTQALLALEAAYTHYVGELMQNIRGKIEEKRGGPVWVPAGLTTLQTSTQIIGLVAAARDFSAARAGVSAGTEGIKLVGSGLAIAGAAINIGIGIRNFWARGRIAREEQQILSSAQRGMERYRSRAFGGIETAATQEQARYASGRVRSSEGFRDYMQSLASTGSGEAPALVDLTTLENSQLDELFDAIVATEGVPYNELYQAQLEMIAKAGRPMWNDFESRIDALPRVI